MRFTKMHGAGNDYVYVDCFAQSPPADPATLAIAVSHRHFGVGADGLILIRPSDVADARMQMFNADGSEAQMCGNGIRCVAKYVFDHGICVRPTLNIETGAGVLAVALEVSQDKVDQVRVDMGTPILAGRAIPTTWDVEPVVNQTISVAGVDLSIVSVSMGNPHCIVFVDELTDEWVLRLGPLIEQDAHFPERVNVEFVQVLGSGEVRQRTWERGSGETWACGTGASAVCVAGALTERTERRIVNHLRGGDLCLEWSTDDDHVYMTGPAVEVFTGDWPDG